MNKNTPILVGIHQYTQRWQAGQMPQDPLSLIIQASKAAIEDSGQVALKDAIDAVYIVNIFSYAYQDAPGELSKALGIDPQIAVYTTEGGNTPQYLVNQAALALEKGEIKAALLTGCEVVYGFKKATKSGMKLDWPKRESPAKITGEVRVPVNDVESAYELYTPANVYPIFETALRAQKGHTPEAHQKYLGDLYEKFAQVAAQHPQAWSQDAPSSQEIAEPSDDNRMVCYPYTKRMNANINVDQAAALVMTTVSEAERLGIPSEKWVVPMGGAHLNEVWEVSRRPKLYESQAIREASRLALEQSGLSLEQIDAFDLYSCFPCAVQMGREAVGISETDARTLTLTGGLSFFGGAGNNYVMHAIATAVETIRQNPAQKILISALGWYATKHAIGIYGKEAPARPWRENPDFGEIQQQIDATELEPPVAQAEGVLEVEGYTIKHGRDGSPEKGIVIGRLEDGRRTVSYIEADAEALRKYEQTELVGQKGQVRYDSQKKKNFVKFDL